MFIPSVVRKMEGAGSRDISNYYLGGIMPRRHNAQTQQTDLYTSGTDLLELHISDSRQADLSSVGDAFNVDLGPEDLRLGVEEQNSMMKSFGEIFELEQTQEEDEEMIDGSEEENPFDLEDQQRRTERLKGVLRTLAQLWWNDSEHMNSIAEKLADGSRDRRCSLWWQ